MKIHDADVNDLVLRITARWRFALAGYSDAEWYCVLGERQGERTGLGQVLDAGHGRLLLDVLRRRQGSDRFLFAVPRCLYGLPSFCNGEIDWLLGRENIRIEALERDALTDDLARAAGLYPLIDCLRRFGNAAVIGPAPLRGLRDVLGARYFVEISTPNLHLEPGGIERAVAEASAHARRRLVWCVSAGVSAAVLIDRLWDVLPHATLIDCGSIWDAFFGVGGQRQWRAELYADPEAWEAWKRKCLTGQ